MCVDSEKEVDFPERASGTGRAVWLLLPPRSNGQTHFCDDFSFFRSPSALFRFPRLTATTLRYFPLRSHVTELTHFFVYWLLNTHTHISQQSTARRNALLKEKATNVFSVSVHCVKCFYAFGTVMLVRPCSLDIDWFFPQCILRQNSWIQCKDKANFLSCKAKFLGSKAKARLTDRELMSLRKYVHALLD